MSKSEVRQPALEKHLLCSKNDDERRGQGEGKGRAT